MMYMELGEVELIIIIIIIVVELWLDASGHKYNLYVIVF